MRFALLLAASFALVAVPGSAADPPPAVDLTGHTESDSVEIRPRVTGFITKIAVKDGETVQKGDLLAEIDSRLYKIELDKAKAQLVRAEAQVKAAEAQLNRLAEAVKRGIVSKEELEKAAAEREVAKAEVDAGKAGVAYAEIQLSYTRLVSPIDGRLSQFKLTEGNVVRADETSLVTVVRTDPLYVSFDVDEKSFLRMRDTLKDNKATVAVGFANDEGYPHKVTVEFVAPTFDAEKGTVRLRAKLPNPKGDYAPGMFVRVRITPAK